MTNERPDTIMKYFKIKGTDKKTIKMFKKTRTRLLFDNETSTFDTELVKQEDLEELGDCGKTRIGFEHECIHKDSEKYKFPMFIYKYDPSCGNENVPRSPIVLTKGVYRQIEKYFNETKFKVNHSCGGHIHVDILDKPLSFQKQVLKRYMNIRYLLNLKYNTRYVRDSNNYSKISTQSVRESDIRQHNCGNKTTIEFRFFDAFENFDDWKEKIKVSLALYHGGKLYENLKNKLQTELYVGKVDGRIKVYKHENIYFSKTKPAEKYINITYKDNRDGSAFYKIKSRGLKKCLKMR